jgi:cytochrome oxidase Cu insertion factor (SCO1/SenC/PrrC family)
MRLRNISRIIVIALVALVGGVALIRQELVAHQAAGAQSNTSSSSLTGGTALHSAMPAISLHDQTGALVTNASLHGHPVILTFMDMTCTQECPIIAQELQLTANFLGAQKAAQVEWVVVSVNPNNTPTDAADFLKKQNVTLPVKVLLGAQTELSPVWKEFGIYVEPSPTDVTHTAATFLIDQSGKERMIFLDSVDSKALAADLSTVLAEK